MQRLATLAGALLLAAAVNAGAQDPTRLPGVVVKADSSKPGPRLLTGIVVDTAGNVIAGAEVSIPELERRLHTRDDGTFRFDSVPRGTYAMRARKIGYAPQVRTFDVDTAGGIATFNLLPLAHALPPIVTSAVRGGLSGVVGDTAFNPIKGATVRVLSTAMETRTDSLGAFYIPVKSGSYMVAITSDSFSSRLVSVAIPRDSGRRITAWLQPRTVAQGQEQAWVISDLNERRTWIRKSDGKNHFYTREDLLKMNIEWIYDVVEMTAAANESKEAYSRNCWVVVNGGPSVAKLSTLTIDDVESVEVYPQYPSTSPSVAAAAPRGKNAKVKGPKFLPFDYIHADLDNWDLHCAGVYVWLR